MNSFKSESCCLCKSCRDTRTHILIQTAYGKRHRSRRTNWSTEKSNSTCTYGRKTNTTVKCWSKPNNKTTKVNNVVMSLQSFVEYAVEELTVGCSGGGPTDVEGMKERRQSTQLLHVCSPPPYVLNRNNVARVRLCRLTWEGLIHLFMLTYTDSTSQMHMGHRTQFSLQCSFNEVYHSNEQKKMSWWISNINYTSLHTHRATLKLENVSDRKCWTEGCPPPLDRPECFGTYQCC